MPDRSRLIRHFFRSPLAVAGAAVILICLAAAVCASLLAPHNPYDLTGLQLTNRLKPPMWLEGGSASFPLGTDDQGRGILSTILYGLRASFLVGFGAVALALCAGAALGLFQLSMSARVLRGEMMEVVLEDYIRTARAKGLPERLVIWRHALRNALLPVITLLGLSVPGLVGGSVIIESSFALPGLGQLFYEAVMARDYQLIMGNLVFGAVLTLAGNLVADLGYALADPRIRAGARDIRGQG
jgi:ABC-type dipeptide/oligopeptide/nickel transport system permease component